MFQNLQLLTIAQLFEAQAKLSPNTEAVIFEGNTLSYQELDQMANKLANYLYFKGVRVGSLVGIFLDRSIHQIISILATLKAGAAYVPLDLAYPSERLQFMLEDSGTPLVITHSHLLKSLPPSQAQGMCLDLEWPTIETIMVDQLPQQATPDNLAYIIYLLARPENPKVLPCITGLWLIFSYGKNGNSRALLLGRYNLPPLASMFHSRKFFRPFPVVAH